ncbi:LLM class flavin-dependent oxidoreductase [Bosea sp. (in: a-proteobacteria)]|uniref:LLM class flavin-dependent oxidoreductase n=1 Tax=Bosea vestrisii TaxID=151416 RepID=A0ABW0HCV1_9HYPH|nr:LLM class flavin-dependent oxidoreductase [Bosea sp. (in: a-proteobacteria)]MBR3194677.1 LLM class flavin-dependent oxidoreductase [Bosea sp. (in: a-proteobacteria)]
MSNLAIRHIAFLTPGNYDDADPRAGLEETLSLFEHGEALGFDSAWVRQRHLEPGVSSAAAFLAAASQRTSRIGLGTAVIQIGYENPFRLAEDLSLVDVLSGGRLNVGLSAGPPPFGKLLGERFFDADPASYDFSHARVARLARNLDGDWLGDADARISSAAGEHRPRLRPHAPGLRQRLWYGGGSLRSARWAAENGFHLLVGNLNTGEATDDFFVAQRHHIETFRSHWRGEGEPKVAVGRVIVPLDSADAATRRRYRDYAASRHERTLAPQGERRTLFTPDLVGTSAEIVERLAADPVLPLVDTLRLELPYNFSIADYRQLVADFAALIAPALGWRGDPSPGRGRVPAPPSVPAK